MQERAILEEHLYWARIERQKLLTLSAEADETIWNLTAHARRTMQERDEARNQARIILANVQARNAQRMMLPGRAHSLVAARSGAGLFDATGNSQALAPATTPFWPSRETTMMPIQHAGNSIASSSNFGHMNLASSMGAYFDQPPLHGFTALVQEPFDPDMFLVDAVESPQDAVPATAGLDKNSGAYEHLAQQWKGKSVMRHAADHAQAP
jgi:hypothetical protein